MDTISILPANIRFSQNNISNRFSAALYHEHIGEVVDKIYDGDEELKARIMDNISVGRWNKPGHEDMWFTVNNRSLWVLKQLQKLDKIETPLNVKINATGIGEWRFTTTNKGVSILVRKIPVGGSKSKPDVFWNYEGTGRIQWQSGDVSTEEAFGGWETVHAVLKGFDAELVSYTDSEEVTVQSKEDEGEIPCAAVDYDTDDDGYDSDEYYH